MMRTAPTIIKSLIKVPYSVDKYVNDIKAKVLEIAWLSYWQIRKE